MAKKASKELVTVVKSIHGNFKLPISHSLGMEVPVGGSSCYKCKYVSEDKQRCSNQYFVEWNESKDLPANAMYYCCDLFEES